MRTVKIGDKEVGLKGTPLALLYYRQEFKTDLLGDLTKFSKINKDDLSDFDSIALLRLAWAMAKADNGVGKQFPNFTAWLEELDSFDLSDQDMILSIIEEAQAGFFRGGGGKVTATK